MASEQCARGLNLEEQRKLYQANNSKCWVCNGISDLGIHCEKAHAYDIHPVGPCRFKVLCGACHRNQKCPMGQTR